MKAFKNFLLWLLVIASISGCGLLGKQKPKAPETYGASMRILYDKDFTRIQFDSICVADTIPADLRLWRNNSIVDYETNARITEYMYIKHLGMNEELFRLMMVNDSTYNIYKRVVYGNKEE